MDCLIWFTIFFAIVGDIGECCTSGGNWDMRLAFAFSIFALIVVLWFTPISALFLICVRIFCAPVCN